MTDTATPDSATKKGFLRGIRAFLQAILHYALVPVIALLKALVALFTHLETELGKF